MATGSEAVTCKGCGARPGQGTWSSYRRHYELTVRYGMNAGDHDEYVTEDGGIFCSGPCLAKYLGRAPV